ncbi:MAG: hypothetical protein WC595_04515 [Candidatus Nanoarchaeia archaeon]
MTFESKLKEVVEAYGRLLRLEDFPEAEVRMLFERVLEGREVEFKEEYCRVMITAPGLQTHQGVNGMWDEEKVKYEGKNGKPPLAPQGNGFVTICFMEEGGRRTGRRIEKISLDWSNKLKFPEQGMHNRSSGTYMYQSERGCISAEYVDSGKGYYWLKEDGQLGKDRLELKVALTNDAVRWITFDPKILGKKVLTTFFEDIGYTGLDLLVE